MNIAQYNIIATIEPIYYKVPFLWLETWLWISKEWISKAITKVNSVTRKHYNP